MTRARLSKLRLAVRTAVHHRGASALVGLAAAAATAIVTGALLVGDSVRGSLEDRVRERLGRVDFALVSSGFVRQVLAADLAADPGLRSVVEAAVPAIVLEGSVENANSRLRATGVQIVGVPESFWGLAEGGSKPGAVPGGSGWTGRRAAVNSDLARAIGAGPGDAVLVRAGKTGNIPAEHVLGRRTEAVETLRLDLESVLPDEGLALFDYERRQQGARNIFVPLETLARALEKEGLASSILIAAPSAGPGGRGAAAAGPELAAGLLRSWKLEDAGLRMVVDRQRGRASVESRGLLLSSAAEAAVLSAVNAASGEASGALTYLANTIAVGGREVPYSTVAATPSIAGIQIRPGEIVLNDWAALDLEARIGDEVRLAFYTMNPDHSLEEAEAVFTLARIVPLEGEAADPGWTPEYPGITSAASLKEWDPPFPVDLKRVREKDETYWDERKATPKGFISLEDGRRLWSSRFGELTSVRVGTGSPAKPIEDLAREVESRLLALLEPAAAGISLRAVKEDGLEAAREGTDFATLFVAFSSFLIVSALVLVAMVFRLACERRARELGILAAVGFPPRGLVGLLLLEGTGLAAAGAIVGSAGGIAYAALLMAGLRSWWKGAVNAPFLSLHVEARSLAAGALISVAFAVLAIFAVLRRVARTPPRRLLAGSTAGGGAPAGLGRRTGPGRLLIAGGTLLLGALVFLAGLLVDGFPPEAAFFGAGSLLLAGALACVGHLLRGMPRLRRRPRRLRRGSGWTALLGLGVRYAGRFPSRSLLTVVIIACAAFIIAAVSASRGEPGSGPPRKGSGDGGFSVAARSSIPLLSSLATREGCETLGLRPETWALLERSTTFELRVRPGDDASCLNLSRPLSPRILGVPPEFRRRGGFAWAKSLAASEAERRNPWLLLENKFEDGAIPAVGDANTVTWILHSSLGKEVTVLDDGGREVRLRLVGLLSHSIFQGELLVSGERLEERFPGVSGRASFLFETGGDVDAGALIQALEEDLADNGLDAERTGDILRSYQAVENTYLSTFEVLGGLGLLLGTVGLGTVLLRNVHERRGELAVLRAVGYSRGALAWIVLGETAFLLTLGLIVGGGAALLPVLARPGGLERGPGWESLAILFLGIFAAGMASSVLALRSALRAPLIPALRAE